MTVAHAGRSITSRLTTNWSRISWDIEFKETIIWKPYYALLCILYLLQELQKSYLWFSDSDDFPRTTQRLNRVYSAVSSLVDNLHWICICSKCPRNARPIVRCNRTTCGFYIPIPTQTVYSSNPSWQCGFPWHCRRPISREHPKTIECPMEITAPRNAWHSDLQGSLLLNKSGRTYGIR